MRTHSALRSNRQPASRNKSKVVSFKDDIERNRTQRPEEREESAVDFEEETGDLEVGDRGKKSDSDEQESASASEASEQEVDAQDEESAQESSEGQQQSSDEANSSKHEKISVSPLSSEDEKEEETAGGGAPPSDNEVGAYAGTDEDIKDEPVRSEEDITKENEEDNTKENDVNDEIVQEDKDIKDLTPPHTPTTPS